MFQVSHGRHGLVRRALIITMLLGSLAATVATAGPAAGNASIDPDFASEVPGTSLVGQGNVQLEANVARASDGQGAAMTRVWSTPTLLRLGMPNYEIRVQSSVYSRVRTYNSVNNGMSDLTLGIKGMIPQSYDRDLSLAVVLQAGLPSGSKQFKQDGVRPEVQFLGAWQLPHDNAVSGIAGLRSDVDNGGGRFATGVLGMNFAHTWNPRVTTYGEVAAREIRTAARGGKNMMLGMGAAWRAMPGTQLDATAGWGIKDNDTDFQWKLGFSRRFRPPSPGAMSKKDEKPQVETPSATTEDGK